MPGFPQPFRWPTRGRIHPSAHGQPRWVPLSITTAPARNSFLEWETSCTAALRQYLQPSRHVSPWQLHGGAHAHFDITCQSHLVGLRFPTMDGEPTPQSTDTPGGHPAFEANRRPPHPSLKQLHGFFKATHGSKVNTPPLCNHHCITHNAVHSSICLQASHLSNQVDVNTWLIVQRLLLPH